MKNSMLNIRRNLALALALVATSLTAIVAPSGAQASSSRWSAWTGCWASTVNGLSQVEIDNLPTVCVAPTSSADVVEIATISKGQIVGRDTVDASGATRAITAKDCSGTKSASWSKDERRVYLRSSYTCGSNRTTVSSIIAMNDLGQWLDVRGVASGDAENVRVARYRPVAVPGVARSLMPSDVRDRLVLEQGARIAAGAPVGVSAILEASKQADSAVVEAWVLERNQKFAVDADLLVKLADSGVQPNITDAIVAVSNPREFTVADNSENVQTRESDGRRVTTIMAEPLCSPYSSATYNPYAYGMSAYDYDRYGCGYMGYRGYGSSYGYNGYGYGYGPIGGGYRYPAVIVITGSGAPAGGQAVKGRGYTQGVSSGTASQPAKWTGPAAPSQASSSSSSSSSTSSSTQQSSAPAPAQTEQRTAKPRSP